LFNNPVCCVSVTLIHMLDGCNSMKLTLERWALIAEVIGGLAVIVSVIYLAFEVGQNTQATRSLTHQQMFDTTTTINQSVSNDAQLAELLARANKNYEELSDGEKNQLTFLWVNWFNMWHSGYADYQAGFLDPKAWILWDEGMTIMLSSYEASRKVWDAFDTAYNREFQTLVNERIKKLGPVKNAAGVLHDER
jgi:hypothetical protein